jgi:hypothetical protein
MTGTRFTEMPSLDAPIGTPIELRLGDAWTTDRYVFTLWMDGHGIIRHSLDNGRGGMAQSVSNLQLKQMVPKKAVPGWQAEAVAAAGSGLFEVEEIR